MKHLDREIQEAFDAVTMPPGLKERTLKRIDACATDDKKTPASGELSTSDKCSASSEQATSDTCSSLNERSNLVEYSTSSSDVQPSGSASPMRHTRFHSHKKIRRNLRFALAACLVLVALGFGGAKLYATETAFVGIDVNPSVELGINCFDRVVSQRAVNEDGADILADMSLVGKSYDEAMAILSSNKAFMVFVDTNGYVEISVTSDDELQAQALSQTSDRYLKSWPCEGSCHSSSSGERDAALKAGMGINRYRAALQLIELNPSVTLEECRNLSMRELRDRIAVEESALKKGYSNNADTQDGKNNEDTSTNNRGNGCGSGRGMGSGSTAEGGRGGSSNHTGRE